MNLSVLSLLDRRLKPSHHVGLSIREAAALEGSQRSQSEAFVPLDVGLVCVVGLRPASTLCSRGCDSFQHPCDFAIQEPRPSG